MFNGNFSIRRLLLSQRTYNNHFKIKNHMKTIFDELKQEVKNWSI